MILKDNYGYKALETNSTLAFVCIILGLIFRIPILFYVAVCFLFVALFVKSLSVKIARGWLKFAEAIGSVNNKIILAIIYYVFLTPLAFFYRIFHGDFMNIKIKNTAETNWNFRQHRYTKEDFEKLW